MKREGSAHPRAANAARTRTRFDIDKQNIIGSGGFGTVYKAKDLATTATVAVKVAFHGKGEDPQKRKAAIKEFKVLQGLNHPNIVRVIHCAASTSETQIFMEWMSGGSVDAECSKDRLHEEAIRRMARDALQGLAYLHSNGILHRDIKPDNMLINETGTVKLSDFGSSRETKATLTAGHSGMVGTPQYLAPELVRDEAKYSKGSDMWAWGCSVIQMATGKPPWAHTGKTTQHGILCHFMLLKEGEHYPPIPSHLSQALQQIILSTFAYDPLARPQAIDVLMLDYFTSPSLPPDAEDFEAYTDELNAARACRRGARGVSVMFEDNFCDDEEEEEEWIEEDVSLTMPQATHTTVSHQAHGGDPLHARPVKKGPSGDFSKKPRTPPQEDGNAPPPTQPPPQEQPPQVEPSSPRSREAAVKELCICTGSPSEDCELALELFDNNVDAAADWLFSATEEEIRDAKSNRSLSRQSSSIPNDASVTTTPMTDEEKQLIQVTGCSLDDAKLALSKCRNDAQYAANWLFQHNKVRIHGRAAESTANVLGPDPSAASRPGTAADATQPQQQQQQQKASSEPSSSSSDDDTGDDEEPEPNDNERTLVEHCGVRIEDAREALAKCRGDATYAADWLANNNKFPRYHGQYGTFEIQAKAIAKRREEKRLQKQKARDAKREQKKQQRAAKMARTTSVASSAAPSTQIGSRQQSSTYINNATEELVGKLMDQLSCVRDDALLALKCGYNNLDSAVSWYQMTNDAEKAAARERHGFPPANYSNGSEMQRAASSHSVGQFDRQASAQHEAPKPTTAEQAMIDSFSCTHEEAVLALCACHHNADDAANWHFSATDEEKQLARIKFAEQLVPFQPPAIHSSASLSLAPVAQSQQMYDSRAMATTSTLFGGGDATPMAPAITEEERTVMEFTGCSREESRIALEFNRRDVQHAVDWVFNASPADKEEARRSVSRIASDAPSVATPPAAPQAEPAREPSPPPPPPPKSQYWDIFGCEYEKVTQIGRSSNGAGVWKVNLSGIDRANEVACVKEIKITSANANAVTRIEEINRTLANAQPQHPNVLRPVGMLRVKEPETHAEPNVLVLGMALGYGSIKEFTNLSELQVKSFIRNVVDALAYAHNLGIAHGNLSVENVIFFETLGGHCKVTDWGVEVKKRRWWEFALWMAPEITTTCQYPCGPASDIWSLGILTMQLLAGGRSPWPEFSSAQDGYHHVADCLPFLPSDVKVSDDCQDFLFGCCCVRDPSHRWSAQQLTGHPWFAPDAK